jgi:hypothetical protein
MPRPTNKKMLLEQIQKEHQTLLDRISSLSEEEMIQHHEGVGYAIKDVLTHLSAWEQLVLGWYRAGVKGEQPHLPLEGYNWRQIPELNQMFYQRDRQKPLADVLRDFHASYAEILTTVQTIDESLILFQPPAVIMSGLSRKSVSVSNRKKNKPRR